MGFEDGRNISRDQCSIKRTSAKRKYPGVIRTASISPQSNDNDHDLVLLCVCHLFGTTLCHQPGKQHISDVIGTWNC